MRYIIITLLLLSNSSAYACLGYSGPSVSAYNEYSKIFVAEVTGVNLFEYGKRRAESIARGGYETHFTDFTLIHKVRLVVIKVFRGAVAKTEIVTLGGCDLRIPTLKSYGLFFIHRKTGGVFPVYEVEGILYYQWLLKLYYESLRKLGKNG